MPYCFVPGCNSGYKYYGKSFFKPPKDELLLNLWRRKIPRKDKVLQRSDTVCEIHFEKHFIEDEYTVIINGQEVRTPRGKKKLKESAIPTIFPNLPKYLTTYSKPRKKPAERQFKTGNPSSLLDETNPDWAPSLKLGHDKYHINTNQAKKKCLREADSKKRSSTENLEPTITSVNSVKEVQTEVSEVCELPSGESAFERETSAYDPKTNKTFCYSLSNNAKLKKKGIFSLCPNSPVYMPESENVNIRLENDKLQSSVQQSLENVAGNQIQSADAVTFLVPLHIFKQMQLSASDNLHWDEKEVTALIALYQSEKFLYDKNHEYYYNLHERNKAYERIKNILAKMNFICTIPQIKNFLNILFTKYSSEKAYKDKCIQAGQFTEDTYAPTMWCFGLLQFLDDYIEPGTEIEIKTEVMEKEDQHKEDQHEGDQQEIQLLNSNVDHLDVKAEPEEVSNIEENVQLKIDSTFSVNADFSENLKVNESEMEANLKSSVSNKLNSIKIFSQDSEEKEDIFGEYIASEMKTLKDNPLLYMQTKQAILNVLSRANFNLLNHK